MLLTNLVIHPSRRLNMKYELRWLFILGLMLWSSYGGALQNNGNERMPDGDKLAEEILELLKKTK